MNKDSCRRSRKERIELVKSFDRTSESETREKRQSVKCWRSSCVVEDEDEVWSLMDGVEGGAKPFQLGSRQGKVADHPVVWRVRRSTERAGCRRNNRCTSSAMCSGGQDMQTLESPENPFLKYLAVSLPALLRSACAPRARCRWNVTLQGQPRISFDDKSYGPLGAARLLHPAHCFILPRKHSAFFFAAAASLLPQGHFSKQPTRHREHHNPSNIL